MAYGKGNVTDNSINQHKRMAGADRSGNFGVGKFPARNAPQGGGDHAPLADSARATGPGIGGGKGRHAMQAAPDHGAMSDHYSRGGKA